MGKWARTGGALLSMILLHGCYTTFTHPEVSYGEKLGFAGDSLVMTGLEAQHTEVRFDDDCKRCHADFSVKRYYPASSLYSTRSALSEIRDESPWWRKTGYYDLSVDEVEKTVRRSRRSYNRSSASSGGNNAEYIAPPGVIPGRGNVGSMGGSSDVSANKSKPVPLPVRQKEGDTSKSKSDQPPAVKDLKNPSSKKRRR